MIALDPVQLTGSQQEIQLPSTARSGGSLLVQNESMYALRVKNAGFEKWLGAWWADVIPITNGGLPVTLTPRNLLSPSPAAPSSHALLTLFLPGEEIPGTYPVSIGRQQASYSTPQKLFTAPADGTTYTQTVMIPAGAHSLVLMLTGIPGNVTSLIVQGDATGANGTRYYDSALNPASAAFASSLFWAVILSPHDTLLTFTFRGTGGGGLFAHAAMDPEVVALLAGSQIKSLLFGGDLGQINTWATASTWAGGQPYVNGMLVTLYGSAPAPWQAPNQPPVTINTPTLATSTTATLLSNLPAGKYLYIHSGALLTGVAGATWCSFVDGNNVERGRFDCSTQKAIPIDYEGAPIGPIPAAPNNILNLMNGGVAANWAGFLTFSTA